jgi:hypothetical protein
MDEQFIDRVLRASGVVAGLVGLCGWACLGAAWATAFLLAAAWGIVNLWALARLLLIIHAHAPRWALAAFLCLKIPILYGLILSYLLWVPWRPSALIGGISLPYAVIILKALGRFLVEAMGRKGIPPETTAGSGQQDRVQ